MKPFTYESHAGSHKTSPEKPKLHLYRPDGSVHYIRPELSATKGAGSSSALPTREVDFEQLPDGRLAEIIEDPDDPKRSLLAVGRDDSYELVKSVQSGKETLVPIPRQEELLRSVRLPRGIEGLRGMTTSGVVTRENVFFTVHNFIREHVAVKPEHAFVLTFFVVSTWFVDRMHIAPYLMIVGPPQSGKTTLLNVLALLCRRPLLIGDISSAALYRTVSRIHPTLLLDESTTQVGQSYRAQRHFLRLGSTRQGVARYGEMFDCYGAKVFAALEPPSDEALNSRSIIIPMLTANPEKRDLYDPKLQSGVEMLRQELLRWRLNRWAEVRSARVPGSEVLPPRAQDLLGCLAGAAPPQLGRQFLLEYFKRTSTNADEDWGTVSSRLVNSVLSKMIHVTIATNGCDQRFSASVSVKDITCAVNRELRLRDERIQLKPEKVGHMLTALGLTNRERTNCGIRLWLDLTTRRRIHLNAKTLGQEQLLGYYGPQMEACPLCGEDSLAALLGKLPIPPESESTQSSDPAQNISPAGNSKADGIDNVGGAAKTSRRRKRTHSQQPSPSKRRGRTKR